MPSPVISARNIGKKYRLGATLSLNTLRDHLAHGAKRFFSGRNYFASNNQPSITKNGAQNSKEFWALRDINFDIHEGEVVGIIGANGAGKSTLVKILSQITEPTTGEIGVRGRVASLLEVGTGFHPELSGRENIFMNGAILGMSKAEIRSEFDGIVDFAGVEQFLDTPVKRYSSGMLIRLGFAVAAHLEPEVLVVDEVLAVGDAEFQRKCLGKMKDVSKQGRTILFVSHNMAAVEMLCGRGILLSEGQVQHSGPVGSVTASYLKPRLLGQEGGYASDRALIREVRLVDGGGMRVDQIPAGSDIKFEIRLQSAQSLTSLTARITITTVTGVRVCNCNSRIETNRLFDVTEQATVIAVLPQQRLAPGRYLVAVGIFYHGEELESAEPAFAFDIMPTDIFGTGLLPSAQKAIYLPQCNWSFEGEQATHRSSSS